MSSCASSSSLVRAVADSSDLSSSQRFIFCRLRNNLYHELPLREVSECEAGAGEAKAPEPEVQTLFFIYSLNLEMPDISQLPIKNPSRIFRENFSLVRGFPTENLIEHINELMKCFEVDASKLRLALVHAETLSVAETARYKALSAMEMFSFATDLMEASKEPILRELNRRAPLEYFYFDSTRQELVHTCESPDVLRHLAVEPAFSPAVQILEETSRANRVWYSPRIPVEDESAARVMTREELSRLIAKQRSAPFTFTTGLFSSYARYSHPLKSFVPTKEISADIGVTEPRIWSAISRSVISITQNPLKRFLIQMAVLQEQFLIANMGEAMGFGLFNRGDTIPAGTCLGIYEGEFTKNTSYDYRHMVMKDGVPYWESSQYRGGFIGISNHSDTPNAALLIFTMSAFENPYQDRERQSWLEVSCLFAIKDIEKNHEITWDYGPIYPHEAKLLFNCFGQEVVEERMVFSPEGKELLIKKVRDPGTGFFLD